MSHARGLFLLATALCTGAALLQPSFAGEIPSDGALAPMLLAQADQPAADAADTDADDDTMDPDADLVEEGAIAALLKMGDELVTLQEFTVTLEATYEQVMANSQKIEFGGTTEYRVRRPDRMRVDMETDTGSRSFFYDGQTLTVYNPAKGFYGVEEAKPTIRETIAWAEETYGIEVPIADLFDWGADDADIDEIEEAFFVGPARIDGVLCAHYAYSTAEADWEVWIEAGSRPLPRKILITDLTEPEFPQFRATLHWSTREHFGDWIFSFSPPANAKKIPIVPLSEMAASANAN